MLYLFLLILSYVDAIQDQVTSDTFENTSVIPPIHGLLSKREVVEVCNSTSCKEVASRLLYLMDPTAIPCEDFPEYVCKNMFSTETPKSFEKFLITNVSDSSEEYRKDFRDFYKTCMDFQTDFAFSDILKFSLNQHYGSLTEVLVELILRQSCPFFDIGLDIDKDTEKYIFQITLPGESELKTNTDGWSLREQIKSQCGDYLQDSLGTMDNLNEMYDLLKECETDMLEKLLKNYGENMNLILNINNTEGLLRELLTKQQALLVPDEELRRVKIKKLFKPMSIAELMVEHNMVNWKQLFERITTNITFSENEIIQVYFPDYLKKIFDYFKTIEERELISMLHEFSRLELYKNLLQPYEHNKKAYCMSLTQQLMPDVARIMLYETYDPDKIFSAGRKSKDVFNKLKKLLKESLNQSNLKDDSKSAYIKKLDRLSLGLISSGNSKALDDEYRDLNITNNFIENLVSVMRNYRKIVFSQVNKQASAASLLNLFVSPFQDEPKTIYTSNTIALHPGITNRVSSDSPEYIRVAKLGLLLSQGILKHFDPTGVAFIESDNSSKNDLYENLVGRTKDLLHTFYLNTSMIHYGRLLYFQNISRDHLLNELISDNAAFRLITDYYDNLVEQQRMPWIHKEFTVKHVFLIAATQVFCGRYSDADLIRDIFERGRLPFSLRIQNMVSNSAFFSEAFECPDGSPMSLQSALKVQFPYFPSSLEDEYDEYISNDYS